MKQLIIRNKIVWLLALSLSFLGCDNDDDNNNIKEVVAKFVHSINEETGMVSFINLSENADNYSWDLGDGTSSTLVNPEKTYPTGTYTVVLTAENDGGTSTFEDEIVINVPLPINFPVNFDDPNVNYEITTFGGATFEILDNPDLSGSNPENSRVGAITNNGATFEGFFFNLGVPIDFTELQSFKADFWSDTPIDVLMKLEEGTEANIETTASHGGTGWEEIYFTFDSMANYSRIVFFVDGPGTTAGTFYFDDIVQFATDDIPCPETELELPIDFDCNSIAYTEKIVGNVSFDVVDNPELSGINSEPSKVGQITNVGANWENAFFNLDVPIDFTTDKGVRMKLFSNQALPILLKFEDGTEAPVENAQSHGGTGWEELTFQLNSSASYNDMVLFVDGPGTAAGVFYVDDIEQVFIEIGPPFDDGLLTNGDFEDGETAWSGNALNVQTEGGNSFNFANVETAGEAFAVNLSQVVEIIQGETYELSFKASTNEGNTRTMLVGIGLNEDPWSSATEIVNLTPETQTFTLTLTAADFGIPNSRVLFDMGADTGVVVIDDVALFLADGGGGGCTGGPTTDVTSFPVDFEDCEGFNVSFGSNQSREIVDNPVSGGINTSDKVYKFTKLTGADGFGGFQNIFDVGSFTNNSTLTFKIYSTLPDQEVRLEIVAIPNDGTIGNPAPYVQTLTTANEWIEMSFDLSVNPFPNSDESVYTMLVVKPGNIDPGTTPADVTFYLDDFDITPN